MLIKELEAISERVRKDIIKMLAEANKNELRGGHPGGSLSCVELLVALYYLVMRNPKDVFLLSKGHAAPCVYSILAERGIIQKSSLKTLRRPGGLQGHPNSHIPGVDFPSGSLAQLLSVGIGMAMANRNRKVYVLLGDGELQEGQIWEAAMSAGHYMLDNLVAIIDCNGLQETGWVDKIMDIEPILDKFKSFNWYVIHINGHDFKEIIEGLNILPKDRPTAIIAHTIKGKGIDFMENQVEWHGVHNREKLQEAL